MIDDFFRWLSEDFWDSFIDFFVIPGLTRNLLNINLRIKKQKLGDEWFADSLEITKWRTVIKYFFIKDPDGMFLEVVEDNRGL